MNCVYCGNEIIATSKEHIIQNALGGLKESIKICCGVCNNVVKQLIDDDFCKIFTPITSIIPNLKKTNNIKSNPSYKGRAIYNCGKTYDVVIRKGVVVDCLDLKRELRRNLNKNDYDAFEIIEYYFNLGNKEFKNGISKIAFNFALENDIPIHYLADFLDLKKEEDKVVSINFKNAVVPFIALNPFDQYIELKTPIELYHNLILFSQDNLLWCYVDLFNTFQHYVLLSEIWDAGKINETYLQHIQKKDRTIPEINIRRTKDILCAASFYNVKPTYDIDKLTKDVSEKIHKEPYEQDMQAVISNKLGNDYVDASNLKNMSPRDMSFYLHSLQFYMDEDDCLRTNHFRKVACYIHEDGSSENYSYPIFINELAKTKQIDIKEYTFSKFIRLNKYLMQEKSR